MRNSDTAPKGPLTYSQKPIWLGQTLHPSSPLYNMAFAFLFDAELESDLFQRAWQHVVRDSDALRTTIVERDGLGSRRVRSIDEYKAEVLDFRSMPEPVAAFQDWCRERASVPLGLEDQLVDSVLVELGKGRTGWYLNQHHLIADAWSTMLVYQQVASEYAALAHGSPARDRLEPYYSTAAALEKHFASQSEAHEYWSQRLGPRDRTIPLYGRTGKPTDTKSRRLTLELDGGQARALNRLCTEAGFLSLSPDLSRFTVMAAALLSWLHRVSGTHGVGFDTPVAGRPTAGSRNSVGLFIELFPFSVVVDPRDSFRELGVKCLEEAQLFLRHAQPGTSAPSEGNASNVVLNFIPGSFGDFAGIATEVEWIHPGHGDSVHDLRLQVHDFNGTGAHVLHFDFNEQALPDRLQRRSIEHFRSLLEALLDDPDQRIGSVDILTSDERNVLLELDSSDLSPLPKASIVQLIEAQARQVPDAIALRQGQHEITFAQLYEDSAALAATLVDRGCVPGDRVALVARRSTQAVVAILATLRAGAAYVPIDPKYPRARIRQILSDSGARLALCGEEIKTDWVEPDDIVVPIDQGIQEGRGATIDLPEPGLDDLAYLIYTSGSTGSPKGVPIAHAGLVDYLQWASSRYVRGDKLTFPLVTSLAFDLTVTCLFLPLMTGGTLEIYTESDGPMDTALMEVLAANSVDFIKLTPSHLSLLRQVDLSHCRIRRIVVGGEDFQTRLAADISARFGAPVEIHNEYGPTEAVVGCVAHRFDPKVDSGLRVPIGRPADHVRVQILDDTRSPVPEGVPGELWVSRHGLARGYHRLPELTAERFQPPTPASRTVYYRTGDLVRQTAPGELEYLGRTDRQLKVSGFRVEPGEIETVLGTLPGIEQCVVVARQRRGLPIRQGDAITYCVHCGLPSNYPGATFDENDLCSICRAYESIAEHARDYFGSIDDMLAIFAASRQKHSSEYDCLLLLSGGKDSTYALCRLVELGLSVYAFTLDNGYISENAKENMRRMTEHLGVPLEFGTTPAMNAIFRDSLQRFSNVCNGCFKTIYTLSTQRARQLGIPIIVTGLSRGQMFETRLTEEMFRSGRRSPTEVDAAVLAARKVYHRVDDEVFRSLDVEIFQDDRIFEDVQFVDFYRYCDVGLTEVLSYLKDRELWVRPTDTGRSTNCLINDVGIFIHQKERGFHNYALPYSWDVRLGHKTRDAALAELHDELDQDAIRQMLREIGYDENRLARAGNEQVLVAFYVSATEIPATQLRQHLGKTLPSQLIPTSFQRVDAIPLTANGKIDEGALIWSHDNLTPTTAYTAPEGPVEGYLAALWQEQLGIERVGSSHDFFELGGTSLGAMDVMIRLCQEFHIDLPLETLFMHSTLGKLAEVAEEKILDDVAELSEPG